MEALCKNLDMLLWPTHLSTIYCSAQRSKYIKSVQDIIADKIAVDTECFWWFYCPINDEKNVEKH
jgi:hypothetical protein